MKSKKVAVKMRDKDTGEIVYATGEYSSIKEAQRDMPSTFLTVLELISIEEYEKLKQEE